MNRVKIATGLRRMAVGHALVLMYAGVAVAGAPAPPPTTGSGPHQPQHQVASLGDLSFENGAVVKDFRVSYVTHGALNANKDNVVLVMHHYFGDHHSFDFLVLLRLLIQVGVMLEQAHPLGPPLEEAEVTAGTRPPLVVLRESESRLLKDSENVFLSLTVLLKWIYRRYVWLGRRCERRRGRR